MNVQHLVVGQSLSESKVQRGLSEALRGMMLLWFLTVSCSPDSHSATRNVGSPSGELLVSQATNATFVRDAEARQRELMSRMHSQESDQLSRHLDPTFTLVIVNPAAGTTTRLTLLEVFAGSYPPISAPPNAIFKVVAQSETGYVAEVTSLYSPVLLRTSWRLHEGDWRAERMYVGVQHPAVR